MCCITISILLLQVTKLRGAELGFRTGWWSPDPMPSTPVCAAFFFLNINVDFLSLLFPRKHLKSFHISPIGNDMKWHKGHLGWHCGIFSPHLSLFITSQCKAWRGRCLFSPIHCCSSKAKTGTDHMHIEYQLGELTYREGIEVHKA